MHVPSTDKTFVTLYHWRMLTSLLGLLMSDKTLDWASKLPLSAANFVDSVLLPSSKSRSMMMQVFISFILGLVYFFHSSMLAVCTAMRSAPVYMAAIVRSFQRNLFSFFYMLQFTITTTWLNMTAFSHVCEDISQRSDITIHTLCITGRTLQRDFRNLHLVKSQGNAESETSTTRPPGVTRSTEESGSGEQSPCESTFISALLFRVYQTLQDDKIMPPWDRPRRVCCAEVGQHLSIYFCVPNSCW